MILQSLPEVEIKVQKLMWIIITILLVRYMGLVLRSMDNIDIHMSSDIEALPKKPQPNRERPITIPLIYIL